MASRYEAKNHAFRRCRARNQFDEAKARQLLEDANKSLEKNLFAPKAIQPVFCDEDDEEEQNLSPQGKALKLRKRVQRDV